MSDWKTLREQSGLTLEQLAELTGYAIATINGLELRGEGSARLKKKLREVLGSPRVAESVMQGLPESVTPLESAFWRALTNQP